MAPNSNWALDAAGTTDAGQIPGITSDVIFAASGSSNNSTALGADTTIDSLTFGAGSFAVGGANALGIGGTNAGGYALEVLAGSSATLATAASSWAGVTRVNSAGTLTISSSGACGNPDAPLVLDGNLKLNANLTKGTLTGTGIASADTAATLNIQSVTGSTFDGTFEDGLAPLSFTKSGAARLTLVETMTNTGPTTVAAGRLEIGNGGSTGALGSGDITVNAGGVLSWNRSDDITLSNNIFGAVANLIKDGTGSLTLTGNSNFATAGGSGFIINSGEVILGSAGAVPNNIVFGVRGGKLDLNEKDIICGWLDGFDPGLVTDDTATAGTTTLTLNIGGAPLYSGAINNGSGGRVLALVKTGGGTQILSGTSNYTGGTTLLTGLLQVNSNSALGTGPINMPGNNVDITRLQLGNGANIANSLEIGMPTRTNFLGAVHVPTAADSATLSGSILVKASGLVGGTLNGGAFYGPTGTGLLTLAGAVNADAATTQVLVRGGNVRVNTAGTATNWRNEGYLSLGAVDSLNTASVVAMAGINAATLDLNGFNQTLAGVGSSTAHNLAATITNTSGTPAVFTLATDPALDYATYTSVLPMGSVGTNVLDGNTVIAGNLSVVKQGEGTAQLQGLSTFGGNLTISAGTLVADRSNNVNNPANSALGDPQADRSITVDNGATLKFQQGDTLGSATTSVVSTLVVNAGGTVINNGNNFTTFGPVVLNGGTITTTGGAIAGYQSYNLLGTVSVGGSSPSSISVTGPGNAFNGFHLNTATTFDVADATGDSSADLLVSAPLIDRNASLLGSGGLVKSGPGTMLITVASTYTGNTTVTGGVLVITQDGVLADASTITLASSGSLNLTHSGTDTVTGLIIGGIPQPNGLYTFGTGKLKVGLSTPFEDWAILKGLDGTAGKENGPADDPDKDGSTNLAEFAFNGNPLSGSDNGQVYVLTADSDADTPDTAKELILTLAVRKATPAFTAGAPATAPLTDGVNYSIHGSTDLASFGVTVTPVGFVDPGVAITDATNYEYRSFSLNGSNGLAGKGFLRAKAEAP